MGKQLINVIHSRRNRKISEKVLLVIKEDGVKKYLVINEPTKKYFLTEKMDNNRGHYYVPEKSTVEIEVPNTNLFAAMAENIGQETYYNDAFAANNTQTLLKQLHTNYNFHQTDSHIEDDFRERFYRSFEKDIDHTTPISKAYFDIEVDSVDIIGFPDEELAEGRVNAITLFDQEKMKFYTLLLRNVDMFGGREQEIIDIENATLKAREYLKEKFEKDIYEKFKDDSSFDIKTAKTNIDIKIEENLTDGLITSFKEHEFYYNDQIQEFEDNVDNMKEELAEYYSYDDVNFKPDDFDIYFFDDEFELIENFFLLVHNVVKPDYITAWNIKYDLVYLKTRLENLNKTPSEVMTCNEFPIKNVYFRVDTFTTEVADNGSYYNITGWSNWVDQMTLFANIRKPLGKRDSYSLDAIGEEEVGDKKEEVAGNMKIFPYLDYKQFVFYNIKDVLLQYKIEAKNKDLDLLNMVSQITRTRVEKAMKKTTSLRNLASRFLKDKGYILSNNHNTRYGPRNPDEEKKKQGFKGAFVADPFLVDSEGIEVNDKKMKYLFENVVDLDLSSLYPSIILAYNIENTCQYGKIFINDKEGNSVSDVFADNIATGDLFKIGSWIGLPDMGDIIELMEHDSNDIEIEIDKKKYLESNSSLSKY